MPVILSTVSVTRVNGTTCSLMFSVPLCGKLIITGGCYNSWQFLLTSLPTRGVLSGHWALDSLRLAGD